MSHGPILVLGEEGRGNESQQGKGGAEPGTDHRSSGETVSRARLRRHRRGRADEIRRIDPRWLLRKLRVERGLDGAGLRPRAGRVAGHVAKSRGSWRRGRLV